MQKVVNTPPPPPGTLSRVNLYTIALGQVIGVGVISFVGPCTALTGKSVWLAYALAVVLGFLSLLPYVFMTSAIRLGAGQYSYVATTLNYRIAGMQTLVFIVGTIGQASLGISFGNYINSLFPQVPGVVAGVGIFIVFFIINLFGVNVMAKVQKYCSFLLIGALLMFVVAGLFNIKYPEVFDIWADDFMMNGNKGFTDALFTFMYSTVGYNMIMTYGGQAKNAKRDIPFAFIATAVSLLVLYTGVAIAAVMTMPVEAVAGPTMVVVAREILPTPLFILFIVGGPMMALITTINSALYYFQLPFRQACIDGWLPAKWNWNNKHGVCVPMLVFVVVCACVPQLFNFQLTAITNNMQLLTSVSGFITIFALFLFPKKYKNAWEKSHMHTPNWVYYITVVVALIINVLIFLSSASQISTLQIIVSLIGLAICMGFGFYRAKSPKVQIKVSVWEE